MQLTNEWFFWTSAVDKKTCNKIKALGKDDFKSAQIDKKKDTTDEERKNGRKKEYGQDKKIRESDISWTIEQWIIDLVWPYMLYANENSGWNFDITAVESMQITKYIPDHFMVGIRMVVQIACPNIIRQIKNSCTVK